MFCLSNSLKTINYKEKHGTHSEQKNSTQINLQASKGIRILKYRQFRTSIQIFGQFEAVLSFCSSATVREKCPYNKWNNIPLEIRQLLSLTEFKSKLMKYMWDSVALEFLISDDFDQSNVWDDDGE